MSSLVMLSPLENSYMWNKSCDLIYFKVKKEVKHIPYMSQYQETKSKILKLNKKS